MSELGHITSVHRELELDGIRFRYGLIPPCGHEDCNCAGTGSIAIYAALEDEDRWFGLSTHDPAEDVRGTLRALAEGDVSWAGERDWPIVKAWLESDSALYGVPWANITYSDEAPRAVMVRQQIASLKTPARFREEPVDSLLTLRRYINEYDPRIVLRLLAELDAYASSTDTRGPTALR